MKLYLNDQDIRLGKIQPLAEPVKLTEKESTIYVTSFISQPQSDLCELEVGFEVSDLEWYTVALVKVNGVQGYHIITDTEVCAECEVVWMSKSMRETLKQRAQAHLDTAKASLRIVDAGPLD